MKAFPGVRRQHQRRRRTTDAHAVDRSAHARHRLAGAFQTVPAVFTHCGSGSFSLAEKPSDVQLASVRLMGQGFPHLFPARPGPVTLVSIIPHGSGGQIALLEGEAVSSRPWFSQEIRCAS